MGRISDYVETLSAAEREQFKDLIAECTVREASIQESSLRATAAVAQLAEQQHRLRSTIRELEEAGQRLKDTVGRLYLRTVPAPGKTH